MSIRAFPINRLEVISSFATAREKPSRRNSDAKAARAKKPAVKVLSISYP
jgi:hypothetical protein